MLRYYEQNGLLHSERGSNGWREFSDEAVARARHVAELFASGLTIEAVRELGPCLEQPDGPCSDPGLAVRTYRARLAVVEERLTRLQNQRDELARRLASLPEHES
ncbi:hypothetical protein GCM10010464_36990 [Pseudonocardia yunnanensis]